MKRREEDARRSKKVRFSWMPSLHPQRNINKSTKFLTECLNTDPLGM